MKVAIVGTGLIGCERIEAIRQIAKASSGEVILESVFDNDPERMIKIESKYGVPVTTDLEQLLQKKPDWIFICTPHDVAKSIAVKAFQNGSNVLIEKPLGRTLGECNEIIEEKPSNKKLYVGFNYRFYRGIEAAIRDARAGAFGRLISVNMVLGHGNSPGMEKSWKLDPVRCGGGCLIDPGVHLLDLILLLAIGHVTVNLAKEWRGFWNTGIEEEAHVILTDEMGTIFNMQSSLNRWRSSFQLEINGTDGYGIVEGRGRSYGPQTYRIGRRWGWQGGVSQKESEVKVIDNDLGEDSFLKETATLLLSNSALDRIFNYAPVLEPCNYLEAKAVMNLLDQCQKTLIN